MSTELHHILPEIDVTDHSNGSVREDVSVSINGFYPTPDRLSVPLYTMGPLQDSGFSSLAPWSTATSPGPSPTPGSQQKAEVSTKSGEWCVGRYDFAAKVILLGDYGVGKTTLLNTLGAIQDLSWCRCRVFRPNEYVEMECLKNDKKILIRIMDTGGQERFRSMTSSYFRGAHGCVLMFNVDNEESFSNVIGWFNELSLYACGSTLDHQYSISSVLVGTVKPHQTQRVVTAERAFRLAENLNLTYCETLVRDQQMVLFILTRLVNNVIVNRVRRQSLAISIMPSLKNCGAAGKKKKWKCCHTS